MSFFFTGAADASEFLTIISELPALEKVDMTNQWLIGTLPANISFPSLRELYLTDNDISVRFDAPNNPGVDVRGFGCL